MARPRGASQHAKHVVLWPERKLAGLNAAGALGSAESVAWMVCSLPGVCHAGTARTLIDWPSCSACFSRSMHRRK